MKFDNLKYMESPSYHESKINHRTFNQLSYVDELCQYHTSLASENQDVPQYLMPLPRSKFTLSSYLKKDNSATNSKDAKPKESIEKLDKKLIEPDNPPQFQSIESENSEDQLLNEYINSIDDLEEIYNEIIEQIEN